MLSFLLALQIFLLHIIIHFTSSRIISFLVLLLTCFMRELPLPFVFDYILNVPLFPFWDEDRIYKNLLSMLNEKQSEQVFWKNRQ
jgi:hypothetical protein